MWLPKNTDDSLFGQDSIPNYRSLASAWEFKSGPMVHHYCHGATISTHPITVILCIRTLFRLIMFDHRSTAVFISRRSRYYFLRKCLMILLYLVFVLFTVRFISTGRPWIRITVTLIMLQTTNKINLTFLLYIWMELSRWIILIKLKKLKKLILLISISHL